jgi:predicted ester cyclase
MSEENKELVRRYYADVLNGRNLDSVVEYFADERIVEGVRRGCFAYFEAFPDLHCSIEELIAEGDKVFCRSTMTGTHDGEYKGIPATGRHISSESGEVFRIADREVRRLLVPLERRRADAAADGGAGRDYERGRCLMRRRKE